MQIKNWLLSFLKYEPVALSWGLNGGIALVLAFAFHLGKDQEAAAATIVTALAALWSAFQARPVSVSVVTGILATIAGALAAFHFHVPADATALVDAALSVLLPLLIRANVVPVAALNMGKSHRPARPQA